MYMETLFDVVALRRSKRNNIIPRYIVVRSTVTIPKFCVVILQIRDRILLYKYLYIIYIRLIVAIGFDF